MLSGHAVGLREPAGSSELLEDSVSEVEDNDIEFSKNILYSASFDGLARNHVQYETIVWILISLLLVLAWGVGILMLLYLPVRRYVLQKDLSSRKLYVTPNEIVYKIARPMFLPFMGVSMVEKRISLSLVIAIIIEQGCLQSAYGIHTLRVESIAHGKAAPVDELLVQGVSKPKLLKKVIMTEASRLIQDFGSGWRSRACTMDRESTPAKMAEGESTPVRMASITEGSTVGRSPYRGSKNALQEIGGISGDLVLHKLEEVEQSVKKIELLIEKSQGFPKSS